MIINKPAAWIAYGAVLEVTGAHSTDILTSAGHGLSDGDTVVFEALNGGTGLAADTVYTVDDSDTDTFKLLKADGSPALFTVDLTASPMRVVADLTPHVKSVVPNAPTSTSDGRTFGAPYRSRATAGNQSITASFIWSSDLHALLSGHVNEDGDLTVKPRNGEAGKLVATVKYAVVPLPEVRIGSQAEVELTMAVRDRIQFGV